MSDRTSIALKPDSLDADGVGRAARIAVEWSDETEIEARERIRRTGFVLEKLETVDATAAMDRLLAAEVSVVALPSQRVLPLPRVRYAEGVLRPETSFRFRSGAELVSVPLEDFLHGHAAVVVVEDERRVLTRTGRPVPVRHRLYMIDLFFQAGAAWRVDLKKVSFDADPVLRDLGRDEAAEAWLQEIHDCALRMRRPLLPAARPLAEGLRSPLWQPLELESREAFEARGRWWYALAANKALPGQGWLDELVARRAPRPGTRRTRALGDPSRERPVGPLTGRLIKPVDSGRPLDSDVGRRSGVLPRDGLAPRTPPPGAPLQARTPPPGAPQHTRTPPPGAPQHTRTPAPGTVRVPFPAPTPAPGSVPAVRRPSGPTTGRHGPPSTGRTRAPGPRSDGAPGPRPTTSHPGGARPPGALTPPSGTMTPPSGTMRPPPSAVTPAPGTLRAAGGRPGTRRTESLEQRYTRIFQDARELEERGQVALAGMKYRQALAARDTFEARLALIESLVDSSPFESWGLIQELVALYPRDSQALVEQYRDVHETDHDCRDFLTYRALRRFLRKQQLGDALLVKPLRRFFNHHDLTVKMPDATKMGLLDAYGTELRFEFPDLHRRLIGAYNGLDLFKRAIRFLGVGGDESNFDLFLFNDPLGWRRFYGPVLDGLVGFGFDYLGNVFLYDPRLNVEDPAIVRLDADTGELEPIADSFAEFIALDLTDEDEDVTRPRLLRLWQETRGNLGIRECLSFKTSPVLGGERALSNLTTSELSIRLHMAGQIATQARQIPDGARILGVKVVNQEDLLLKVFWEY